MCVFQSFKVSPTDLQMCMSHFFIIGTLCNVKYVQRVRCKQKVFSLPEKSNKAVILHSVCARTCEVMEKRATSDHSAPDFVRIIRAPVYPSIAFVWLNSWHFFPAGVRQCRAEVRPLLRVGRIGWDVGFVQ